MDLKALLADAELIDAGVATVYGVRLADGRRAVVKLHQPVIGERFLRAVQRVQAHAAGAGFPAPQPLAGPLPYGESLATVETFQEEEGAAPDAHDPAVRAAMAAALARMVEVCRPLAHLTDLQASPWRLFVGRPGPPPAQLGDAELEEAAARARELCEAGGGGAPVVGHTKWAAQHVRFAGGRLSAVYSWESLDLIDEAVLAGSAAAIFTANWEAGAARSYPAPEESRAFLDAYERARGRPFTPREQETARAATAYMAAFVTRRGGANLRAHLRRWREEQT